MSHDETRGAGRLARDLGGYDEMLRLERELADFDRRGVEVRMETGEDGVRRLVPIE